MKNQLDKDTYLREPVRLNGKEYAILWPMWVFKCASGDERRSILIDSFNGQKGKTVYWLEDHSEEQEPDAVAGLITRTTLIFTVDERHEKQFIEQNLVSFSKNIEARVSYRKFQRMRGKSFMRQINSKLAKS